MSMRTARTIDSIQHCPNTGPTDNSKNDKLKDTMNMHTPNFTHIIRTALICAMSTPVFAQHMGDIGVSSNALGQLTTHVVTTTGVGPVERIFGAIFGDTGIANFTSNPGFDALPGTFNNAYRLGFNIRQPLQVWDGSGFTPTDPAGPLMGERLKISFLTANVTSGADPVAGFSLAVQPDGGWHRHFSFLLQPAIGAANPRAGIYLLELELWPTAPTLTVSDPFWLVMNLGSSVQDQQLAAVWVRDHLIPNPCPADFDNNGSVDGLDLAIILSNWGGSGSGDIDQSGTVDGVDLASILSAWGACP